MGKRGRPKGSLGPIGPTRRRCMELFDAGRRVAEIAAELGISKQAVSSHLKRSDRSPAKRANLRPRLDRERFAAVWNASPTLAAAARALRLTPQAAQVAAISFRGRGVTLKYMPRLTTLNAKAHQIVALAKRGLRAKEIAERLGVNPRYASQVRCLAGLSRRKNYRPARPAD